MVFPSSTYALKYTRQIIKILLRDFPDNERFKTTVLLPNEVDSADMLILPPIKSVNIKIPGMINPNITSDAFVAHACEVIRGLNPLTLTTALRILVLGNSCALLLESLGLDFGYDPISGEINMSPISNQLIQVSIHKNIDLIIIRIGNSVIHLQHSTNVDRIMEDFPKIIKLFLPKDKDGGLLLSAKL